MIANIIIGLLAAQVILALLLIGQLRENNRRIKRLWQVFVDLYGIQGPQQIGDLTKVGNDE